MSGRPKTARAAWNAAVVSLDSFYELASQAMRRWDVPPKLRQQLKAVLGKAGCTCTMSMADFAAKEEATRLLIRAVRRLRKVRWAQGRRDFYLVTLIDPGGYVSDRSPYVSLEAIRGKARKALKALGMNAIAAIEVHPVVNFPRRGRGRTLMYHVHAIAWPVEVFRKESRRKLNRSRAWRGPLGVRPVSVKRVADRKGDLEWLAYYILKAPHDAKNRLPASSGIDALGRSKSKRWRLENITQGYRPELALRILEGVSQMSLTGNVFGVGEGKVVASGWRRALRKWHTRRCVSGDAEDVNVAKLWRDLRRNNGSKLFKPYKFAGEHQSAEAAKRASLASANFLRLLADVTLEEEEG